MSYGASELASLKALLGELRPLIDAFRVRNEHFAADLVMLGYAIAAWDCAKSTEALLVGTDLSVGAFICARGAFEAGQDAALLASEPDYDASGARARVFDAFEYVLERSRWSAAFPHNATSFPDSDFSATLRQAEAHAAELDQQFLGAGEHIRRAAQYWLPVFRRSVDQGKGIPLHWAGLGRKKIGHVIAERYDEPNLADRLSLIYSMLSRYAHPRTRLETWKRTADPLANSVFRSSDVNRFLAAHAVVVSLILLRDALNEVAISYHN